MAGFSATTRGSVEELPAELVEVHPSCPTPEALIDHVLGLGKKAERRSIGSHIAECPVCSTKARALNLALDEVLGAVDDEGQGQDRIAGSHL